MKVHSNTLSEAIKDYFKGLIEQGKQEVDILEANAEIRKIIDGMEGRLIELPCKVDKKKKEQMLKFCSDNGFFK